MGVLVLPRRWRDIEPPPGVGLDLGHPLTRGLLAYWPLQVPEAIARDLTGRYPLTYRTGAPTLAPGVYRGVAMEFHGSPDEQYNYDVNPIINALDGLTNASISAWCWRSSTSNTVAVGCTANLATRFMLWWYSDGNIYCPTCNGSSNYPTVAYGGTGWHHFLLTFDGSQSGLARVAFYADGVAQPFTGNIGPDPPAALASAANLSYWGVGRNNGDGVYSIGRIQDVAVWNRTLSPADAITLARSPYDLFAPTALRHDWLQPTPAAAVQTAAPISDLSAGGWTPSTGASLFGVLDETVRDDADFIYSSLTPANDTCKIVLGDLSTPQDLLHDSISYVYGKGGDALQRLDLTVSLYQGAATLIKQWTHTNISTTLTLVTQTLSSGEAGAITYPVDHTSGTTQLSLWFSTNAP